MQQANPLGISPAPARVDSFLRHRIVLQAPTTRATWAVLAVLFGAVTWIVVDRRQAKQARQARQVLAKVDAVIQPAVVGNHTLGVPEN